ncbi:C-type lectin domain family 2 member L-like isoform X2 [Mixophyes fleayi]|uniref:C-type lectin domain family 2 member L-like isoform X2 n=1 Tax=Mixophyes fleayi TaxID=3061075 RepID=UPI003F4D7E8D
MDDIAYAEKNFTMKAEKPDNPSCVAQAGTMEQTTSSKGNISSNGSETSCSPDRSEVNTISHGSESSCSPGLYHACPAHWILIDNKCYFLSENKKSYDESERNCTKSGSRLATVKEGVIQKLVTMTAQEFWVGLAALGTHYQGKAWTGRWADGSTETVSEGTGTCAKIGHRLMLENCYTALRWICERDTLKLC